MNVQELAQSTLEAANGDAMKATALLEEHARKDVNVANELLMPLLHQACYDAIRRACIQTRGYIAKQADASLKAQASDGKQRIIAHGRGLMDWILPHGAVVLAEATQDQIMKAVDFYRKQARTELHRATFLELVSKRVGGRKKVKNACTESQLLGLWQEAHDHV